MHRDIEFFRLAGKIHRSHENFSRMMIHHGIVKIEPLEIMKTGAHDISRHWRNKLPAKISEIDQKVKNYIPFFFLREKLADILHVALVIFNVFSICFCSDFLHNCLVLEHPIESLSALWEHCLL